MSLPALLLALLAPIPPDATPAWPMFGGTPGRNMANPAAGRPPDDFDPDTGRNVLWKADLGSRAYTQPVVTGGRVFVGTNNERPRNRRDTRPDGDGGREPLDKAVLMAFDARTGAFLWQAVHDRPRGGAVGFWPKEGLHSTPAVVGDRVYYLTPDAKVVCLDANGFTDGNQGAQDEKYRDPTDADVIWAVELMKTHGVFPHEMSASSSPLVVGDVVFLVTGNGVDEGHRDLPNPDAPAFVALDRHTGKVLWTDNSPGKGVMHGQWASAAFAADPVPQVIAPGGDGWLRAFDPKSGRLLWKFDPNPPGATHEPGGVGRKNDILATPVVAGGRVFVGTGHDPEYTTGPADFWCVDLRKAVANGGAAPARDVSPGGKHSAAAWHLGGDDRRPFAPRNTLFGRTLSNACVVGDVAYVAELHGHLHCLDARTGKAYWWYDTKGAVWASPYFADGKVFLGTESSDLFVFRHDPKPATIPDLPDRPADLAAARTQLKSARAEVEKAYRLRKVQFPHPIRATPSAAGGVLYVATERTLYAVAAK